MAPCRELEQRTDSRHTAARADTSQTLRHEYAIVRIERDDIRHRAERHEVEKLRRMGRPGGSELCLIEPSFDGSQHVKRDAHTRQRATAEAAAGEIGIDDHVGVRQPRPG